MKTTDKKINASFEEFSLPNLGIQESSVIVPTVKGNLLSKYGTHAYYFFNFKLKKGMRVTVSHKDILFPGLRKLREAHYQGKKSLFGVGSLFLRYHYGFNFLEETMLLTVPHNITDVGEGRFLVNLWSYYGYLEVDCRRKQVTYRLLNGNGGNHVFGSQQWYDTEERSRYFITYSMKESFQRVLNPRQRVLSRILKTNEVTGETAVVWEGELADFLHDIHINKTKQYLVVPELGMYWGEDKRPIPSKVLVVDLKSKRHWIIEKFIVAAHAQFDPLEPDVIYFSNHNFLFKPSDVITLFKLGTYSIDFLGPASVYKYRLTQEGPKEIGVFSRPDIFRLTNFHVFVHRNRKVIAAMGSPNFIFIADADTLETLKKIEVRNIKSAGDAKPGQTIPVGTISPSLDGEHLFVHTTRSFQVINVASGEPVYVRHYFFNHTCANHMVTTKTSDW